MLTATIARAFELVAAIAWLGGGAGALAMSSGDRANMLTAAAMIGGALYLIGRLIWRVASERASMAKSLEQLTKDVATIKTHLKL